MPKPVYLNRIASATPPYEVHQKFIDFALSLIPNDRERRIFSRLASKAQIDARYSLIQPAEEAERLDADGFYRRGAFPSTAKRMELYKRHALPLAAKAISSVLEGVDHQSITHLIITSCTGFYAPGLDLDIQREFGLRHDLERSVIGFMGCYAAFNGMKAARHIVRSSPEAKVMMINLELCSLHLQESSNLEQLLAFMQFADGCAASVISSEPEGLELESFHTDVFPEGRDLITWHIGDLGFDMHLSTSVPQALAAHVPLAVPPWIHPEKREQMRLWAVHPGGRSVLDAVADKLQISEEEMRASRSVLSRYGNMSSATVMFVLKEILEDSYAHGPGVGMAFGPGMTMESMTFRKA